MRIVISDFISLDGVAQAPGGAEEDTDGGFRNGGWSHPFFDFETMGPAINGVMEDTRALFFGRRTWKGMAAAWPERAGDPFADMMNSVAKYVVSSTLTGADLTWTNTTLVAPGDLLATVERLRGAGEGAVQVMGSLTLARTLIEHDLVDEYRLMIEPILLGGGKSPYPSDGVARTLDLVSATVAGTGVLICTYRPRRA